MEKISAKNYRVGNIVRSKINGISKVEQIGSSINPEYIGGRSLEGNYWENSFLPVEITKQWLVDFGFEDQKSGFYKEVNYDDSSGVYLGIWAYKSLELALTYSHDAFADWDDLYTDLDIGYVHELQNLYFALTGRELEFKTKTL